MPDPIDNETPDPTSATPADPAESPAAGDTPPESPADDLGEGGKKALEAERKARRDAETARRKLEAELDKIKTANLSEQERAIAEAKATGRAEAMAEANARLVAAEVQVRAAGKLRDPELAGALLGDLSGYVSDDGDIDGERIAADIDELISARPYLAPDTSSSSSSAPRPPAGNVPGGNRGDAPTTFKRSQLADPAFYTANKDAILQAAREGRIVDDIS